MTGHHGKEPRAHPPGLPLRYQPQTQPTPTTTQADQLCRFLRQRLNEATQKGRDAQAQKVTHALLAPGGFLDRFQIATTIAADAPYGLEHAWGLVAATLAVEAKDLACLWPHAPGFHDDGGRILDQTHFP